MPQRKGSTVESMQSLPSKREKFERAGRFPVAKATLVAMLVVGVIVGGVVGYRSIVGKPQVGGALVEQDGARYGDGPVAMTLLTSASVVGEELQIPVADVKAKRIVGLLYSRKNPMPAGYDDLGGNRLPLLAYVAPSGRLVVASSLCEPCHSYEFHIEGEDLVCNACFTHWDLNTLEGKSGGCQAYPPKELAITVKGGIAAVPVSVLEDWIPRT